MKTRSSYLFLLAVCTANVAHCQNLTISGFGTLGIAKSDTDDAQFTRYNQAKGVKTTPGIGTDTNLGLQATYKFSDRISATGQVLTRLNTSTTFTSDMTWGFLKAKLNDDFEVRVGRTALPIFMISDYQNVGFANTMMRPPIELYAQAPIERSDGVDLLYQHSFGDTTISGQLGVGSSRGKLFVSAGGGSVAHYRAPVASLSVSAEHGPFSVRAAHLRVKMNSDDFGPLNSLTGTLTGVGFGQLATDLALKDKAISFTAIGMTMNWRQVVAQAEFGMRRNGDPVYLPETNAWYVMAGYRINKFLPYYSHSENKQKGSTITLPPGFPASGPLYNGVVVSFLTLGEQKSDAVGVRWNFSDSADLKLQVDRLRPQKKTGTFIFGPAAGIREAVTVVGISFDFTF